MVRRKYPFASMDDVLQWIRAGVFVVRGDEVFKGDRKLAVRRNTRRRCNNHEGDPRVDLWHDGKRRSCHISQLVWMSCSDAVIPAGWEIHHIDEDPDNNEFSNLVCVHPVDHAKLHSTIDQEEEVPF